MSVSRRGFLFTLAATCAAQEIGRGRTFPSVAARYLDPATEFLIVRLTDPRFTSALPDYGNRVLTSRAVLYASDATGKWEAFRMDLKKGEAKQLTDAGNLDQSSLAFLPGERGILHFDAGRLIETNLSTLKTREIYRVPAGFEKTPGTSYSEDGQYAALVESDGVRFRLRLIQLVRGAAVTLVDSPVEIRAPLLRPNHASLLYWLRGDPWLVNLDGLKAHSVELSEGDNSQTQWTSDGRALLYLNRPADAHQLTNLREFSPETSENVRVADTSQYVQFHSNADASVFVGASGSKASPYVLILARSAKRELTVAEHRASDAAMVTPRFSPNSQFVIFVSDRHGKPALYWISVDKLVTPTEGNGTPR